MAARADDGHTRRADLPHRIGAQIVPKPGSARGCDFDCPKLKLSSAEGLDLLPSFRSAVDHSAAELRIMAKQPQSKPSPHARPLSQLVGQYLAETFAKQGFASTKLVTHWPDIVG